MCRVLEKLEDVDDKFQIRRKARTTLADAQRQLPQVYGFSHPHTLATVLSHQHLAWHSLSHLCLAVAPAVQRLFEDSAWQGVVVCVFDLGFQKRALLQAAQPSIFVLLAGSLCAPTPCTDYRKKGRLLPYQALLSGLQHPVMLVQLACALPVRAACFIVQSRACPLTWVSRCLAASSS